MRMESLDGGELTLSKTRAFLSFQSDQQTKANKVLRPQH
jgi:hypothetical protein